MPDMKKKIPDRKVPKFNPFTFLLLGLLAWAIISFFFTTMPQEQPEAVPMSRVFELISNEEVNKVTIVDGRKLEVELKNGELLASSKEPEISFYELLDLQDIAPSLVAGGIYEKEAFAFLEVLANVGVPIVTIIFLWWIFRSAGKSAGGIFGMGKSRARLFSKEDNDRIGFKDVAGAKEIKAELVEIVDFLKKPDKYRKLGARIPKGVLLIGPSGVGKTLLARAIAGEAGVPFYSVAGSEFIEMIVGVGSARVRDLFKMAKETSPSLIFIDEIDAIGRHRGRAMAMSNDEREQTLNQILVEMDGFDPRTSVIIIAATNRPDMLDPALIRPGRFDRHIRINLPDVEEREGIIKIHLNGKPSGKTVDVKKLSRQTVGFSGADLENMINEAAILAARKGASFVEHTDLVEASTKVKLGPERRLLQTEDERKVIAYHEAGHALVAAENPDADPVTRISIISRAMSLGHTEYVPKDNAYNLTKKRLLANIRSALGGRAAEEVVFAEETVGAANDIERATLIARKMVTDFGMSALGPINFVSDNMGLWDISAQDKAVGYSESIAQSIDKEVRRIIEAEYANAVKTLKAKRGTLDKLADELLEKETLEQDEFEKIIKSRGETSPKDLPR